MKIPETTPENPFIEFRFDKKGNMTLCTTSSWWGGINDGFISSEGYEGNTCLPKDLDKYLKAYKNRKIKALKKEIEILQIKLKNYQK